MAIASATNNDISKYEYDYLQKPVTSDQLRKAIQSKLVLSDTSPAKFSSQEQVNQLEDKLHQLEEYSQTKDLLLRNLCESLKKYLPAMNYEIKKITEQNSPSIDQDSIAKVQNDLVTVLTIVNQASELQELINLDNYQLLQHFMDNQDV